MLTDPTKKEIYQLITKLKRITKKISNCLKK